MPEIIRFPICPQTNLRTTQNEAYLFRMPEDCPHRCGLPRRTTSAPMVEYVGRGGKVKERRYGCPHALSVEELQRKRRIEKYNAYKLELSAIAKELRFELPHAGFAIYFFLPMPASMLRSKKKSLAMHLQPHLVKPDIDNLLKGVFDSLKKMDQHIYHLAGIGKFWTKDAPCIEFHTGLSVYDPKAAEGEVVSNGLVFKRASKPMRDEDILCPTMVAINLSPSPAVYDAERIDTNDDESQGYYSIIPKKRKYGPIDVNDKAAMDAIIAGSKKRKRK